MPEQKSEKIKIIPNPESVEVVEEEVETEKKPFPKKLVRNILIGAAGAAITGYVVHKIRSKDDEDDSTDAETPWIAMFVPEQTDSPASAAE